MAAISPEADIEAKSHQVQPHSRRLPPKLIEHIIIQAAELAYDEAATRHHHSACAPEFEALTLLHYMAHNCNCHIRHQKQYVKTITSLATTAKNNLRLLRPIVAAHLADVGRSVKRIKNDVARAERYYELADLWMDKGVPVLIFDARFSERTERLNELAGDVKIARGLKRAVKEVGWALRERGGTCRMG